MNAVDTLPKSLQTAPQRFGAQSTAMRQKDLGIWRSYSWQQSYDQVRSLCLGLVRLGMTPGDKACILGDNDPQYFWAQLAVQSARGVAAGIFTDSTPTEAEFIISHSDARFVFAKDQEQCDKLLQIRDNLPAVQAVIYWDHKGMWGYDEPWLMSFGEVQDLGRALEQEQPQLFDNLVAQGQGDDPAIFCYTSGTTGMPKGAIITHGNLLAGADLSNAVDPRTPQDEYLSFLPPAWITENVFGLTGHLRTGMVVNFPEAPETVQENLREIAPNSFLFSARLWESLVGLVQVKMIEATWFNRLLYAVFMPVGHRVANLRYEQRQPVGLWLRLANALGEVAIFQALRDKLGLTRIRSAYSSGAALNPDVIRFFRAIGVNIKQLYGSTECQTHTLHVGDDVHFETVGKPLPGMRVVVDEQGEILVSGPSMFQGYYKNPEASARSIHVDAEGVRWFHTGDGGYLRPDGHLTYLDRLSDMRSLPAGGKYSPQYIEGRLKFSPFIRDVMTLGGDELDFVAALINIDFDNVGRWAERRGLAYTTFVDLCQKPEVYAMIARDVESVNKTLPQGTCIRRFVLLHKEFDPDEAELTRTRKLRRNVLHERYHDIITAIYSGQQEVKVHAAVKYRDGREGSVVTMVRIETMEEESAP